MGKGGRQKGTLVTTMSEKKMWGKRKEKNTENFLILAKN